MLTLEVILHLFHVCAIKSASAWHENFSPLSYAAIAFFNLKIIWLKLLIIWRFARFFALCDGVDPPAWVRDRASSQEGVWSRRPSVQAPIQARHRP